MTSIIQGQNNVRTAQSEQFYEERLMRLEERIKEMEKTLTILGLYLRAVPMQNLTHVWSPNIPIAATSETKMGQ